MYSIINTSTGQWFRKNLLNPPINIPLPYKVIEGEPPIDSTHETTVPLNWQLREAMGLLPPSIIANYAPMIATIVALVTQGMADIALLYLTDDSTAVGISEEVAFQKAVEILRQYVALTDLRY